MDTCAACAVLLCVQVKIADFGLAKQSADAMSTVCGTPQYVAPEVIQGTAHTVYGPEVRVHRAVCMLHILHARCSMHGGSEQQQNTVYWVAMVRGAGSLPKHTCQRA